MQKDEDKKIIGLQVSNDLYNTLKEVSLELGVNISALIRMITIDYLKRTQRYNRKKGKE